jgi:hypothetical protein
MTSHEALLTAVHAQPEPTVTVTLAVPPVRVNLALVGEIEYVQTGTPLWLTVNVLPAIVNVPERWEVEVFASTE